MITIKGFSFATAEDCKTLFSQDHMSGDWYAIKQVFTYLPDFSDIDEEDKENYIYKTLPPDEYLTELEIFSDKWVSIGFCRLLLMKLGMVLREVFPIIQKGRNGENNCLIKLVFEHITMNIYDMEVTIDNSKKKME